MTVAGFDFGTTNSLVSIIKGDRAINFLDDDDGLPIPSVVCYEGAQTIVGRAAKERLAQAGLGVQGNVVRSPKILLGHESVFVEGVERSPVDIVSEVVNFIYQKAASSRRGEDLRGVTQAVVTIPVNMKGKRRVALRDAFRKARISIVQFIHEPLAALYGYLRSQGDYAATIQRYDRQLILVCDWGGGTLDLTLCRLVDGMLFQLANDGTEEVGGDVFDDTIKNEVVRRVLAARGLDDSADIQPDAMTRLLHDCERAKIDLSTRDSVELYVGSFFRGIPNDELDYRLNRADLEAITASLLDKGLARIRKLMEAADVSTAQIAACLATGGMANMPAIRARLHEWFGPQRVHVSERSGTLIAEGAAWIAHDKVRLCLAKNVELLLARNSYMPIIKAGTEMPREGEVPNAQFHLWCADPRDGFAKFQLEAPLRPGPKVLPNERRSPLDNLVVEVDKFARPFQERLELDVQIDENLILHAQARSLVKKGLAECEVHNLEFGLSLSQGGPNWAQSEQPIEAPDGATEHNRGDLVLRSNIANVKDDVLIPGELLYSYDPAYFDVRRSPNPIQVEERLYYEPCAVCGRASNDPLCRCSSVAAPTTMFSKMRAFGRALLSGAYRAARTSS